MCNLNNEDVEYDFSRNNVCIDYLRVRFDCPFSLNADDFDWFFDLFKINKLFFEECNGLLGYKYGYIYGENLMILTGGDATRNIIGSETTLFEIRGSGCRELELLGVDWLTFLKLIDEHNGISRRIDLAIDDYSNFITKWELFDKIKTKSYVTRLRKIEYSSDSLHYTDVEQDIDNLSLGGKGLNDKFILRFGGSTSKQLCIYDKLVERTQVGGLDLNIDSWMRYEMRFFNENSIAFFLMLIEALSKNELSLIAMKLLASFITFKEDPVKDRNGYKFDDWDKWSTFLSYVEKLKLKLQAKEESSMEKNQKWLKKSVSKTLARFYINSDVEFQDLLLSLVSFGSNKITSRDIARINNFRRKTNLEPLSDNDVKDIISRVTGEMSERVDL
ncbi:MAG: replication initiation factor domain-containing protein [Bacilli bacterium]